MINFDHQLNNAIELLKILQDPQDSARQSFFAVLNLLTKTLKQGNKILICGNGGSMCDAMHFAEELTGRYRLDRAPMKAIVLADSAHITCTANDYGFDYIFERLVDAYGNKGDALICLSTSGNSPNILYAIKKAKNLGISTIGFTGKSGGEVKNIVDLNIHIKSSLSERIQEVHMFLLHNLVEELEKQLYPELYAP